MIRVHTIQVSATALRLVVGVLLLLITDVEGYAQAPRELVRFSDRLYVRTAAALAGRSDYTSWVALASHGGQCRLGFTRHEYKATQDVSA